MKTLRTTFILLLTLLLSACGFHLRGATPIPPKLTSVYIETSEPYNYLTLHLTNLLQSLKVRIAKTPADSPYTLRLYDENYSIDTLSESASASTKIYALKYQVTFELNNESGKNIYGPREIRAFRNYLVNEEQVLNTTTEVELKRKELQRDVAYQILNQLGSDAASIAIDNSSLQPQTHPPEKPQQWNIHRPAN